MSNARGLRRTFLLIALFCGVATFALAIVAIRARMQACDRVNSLKKPLNVTVHTKAPWGWESRIVESTQSVAWYESIVELEIAESNSSSSIDSRMLDENSFINLCEALRKGGQRPSTVRLTSVRLTDAEAKALASTGEVRFLWWGDPQCCNDNFSTKLKHFKSLERLDISFASIGNGELRELDSLTNLRVLNLKWVVIDDTILDDFRRSHPHLNCQVGKLSMTSNEWDLSRLKE